MKLLSYKYAVSGRSLYAVLSVDHGMWTEWVSGRMFSSKVKPCSHVVTLGDMKDSYIMPWPSCWSTFCNLISNAFKLFLLWFTRQSDLESCICITINQLESKLKIHSQRNIARDGIQFWKIVELSFYEHVKERGCFIMGRWRFTSMLKNVVVS